MSMTGVRRPGVVTFIGIVIYLQAFLAIVAGVVLLAFRDDSALVLSGVTEDETLVTAIVDLIIGVILFLVGMALMTGGRGARFLVAAVQALHLGAAVAFMFWHHSGAYLFSALISAAIALFVLWALYGNERSEAYFESTP